MVLTAEVQAVVNQLNNAEVTFPDLSTTDARALYIERQAAGGGEPVAMARVDNDHLPLSSATLAIRRYWPVGLGKSPAPTIIYYHGGGWVLGDLDSHDLVCRQLAERSRCQLIAVDYRLAPESPLPAATNDAIAAFEWLITYAESYDIDSNRVAVAGDSAGGQLSAVVALAARDNGWPLAFQALIYPATDMRSVASSYPSRTRNADMPPLTADLMAWFGQQAVGPDVDTTDWRTSPLLAPSLENVPPALVATVGADVLMDEGGLYAFRLRDAGVVCDHAHFPGVIHGSIAMYAWLDVTRIMLDRIADSISTALDESI